MIIWFLWGLDFIIRVWRFWASNIPMLMGVEFLKCPPRKHPMHGSGYKSIWEVLMVVVRNWSEQSMSWDTIINSGLPIIIWFEKIVIILPMRFVGNYYDGRFLPMSIDVPISDPAVLACCQNNCWKVHPSEDPVPHRDHRRPPWLSRPIPECNDLAILHRISLRERGIVLGDQLQTKNQKDCYPVGPQPPKLSSNKKIRWLIAAKRHARLPWHDWNWILYPLTSKVRQLWLSFWSVPELALRLHRFLLRWYRLP